ncbi:hypothetical protein EB118_16775 [bacterium]|nr:hypothetical protein [Actinomycetota bacterium]NDG31710.1 hypothetical protein [bacterium]
MGRPLTKDVNGVKVLGTFGGSIAGAAVDSSAGIRISGRFSGTTNSDYFLVKQRGAKTYIVSRDGTTMRLGVLAPSVVADGDIVMLGSTQGTTPGNIAIAKLTKRLATDFNGNRYKWFLSNYEDSSGDTLVLIPL